MDQFTKKDPGTGLTGRNLRSLAVVQALFPVLNSGGWFPSADVYEANSAIIICMDVSGADPGKLSVVVEEQRVTVSGERQYTLPEQIFAIHQLEVERGFFERAIPLPKAIDVSRAVSEYSNGFLTITLPVQGRKGRISIRIT